MDYLITMVKLSESKDSVLKHNDSKERLKDVLAHVFSVIFIFIIMIIYFYFTFFRGNTLFIDKYDNLTIYEQVEHHSCHITLTEPTIILRLDDVRANSYPTKYVVDELLANNMSVVLGVIPEYLEDDIDMRKYLISLKNNPHIEIAQHGFYHNESDLNITEEQLLEGNRIIQENIGVQPITYIPPYNKVAASSLVYIENHFKVISSGESNLKEGEIAYLGQTISNYYYNSEEEVEMGQIISKCKTSLDLFNICVITLHPQEYSTDINDPDDISKEKMDRLEEMIARLKGLNASSGTFKDIVQCYKD